MDQPTLRTLLDRHDLNLTLVSAPESLAPGALRRPLRWVHSSDLADPTPFLADDLALLTTGTQFLDADSASTAAYVDRLVARGVVGLGFGTEVLRQGIPDALIDACARTGLPLFEVPYDTPFIAIARAHSEAIAAQAYARRTWAMDTQRALAIAALRPQGLHAIVTELARRLDRWVGMFDASGTLVHEHPTQPRTGPESEVLTASAADLVHRGGPAGQSLALGAQPFTLFTFGSPGHRQGVIAIGTTTLDAEARVVVTSVIAMAGLAVAQSAQLEQRRMHLHSQVLAALRHDNPTLARDVLGELPAAPIVVAVATQDAPASALAQWCEQQRAEHGAVIFDAYPDTGATLCVAAGDQQLLDAVAERFGIRLGVSEPAAYDTFSHAHAQATSAVRARGGTTRTGVIRFADTVATSVLRALATDEARLAAASLLAPLRDRADLERALRTWLEHDARFEAAAAELGIHRHTVRARVAEAAKLLGQDLSSFPARAEIWAALHTLGG